MPEAKQDLYEFLGLPKTATEDEIKKACKKAILKNDPDRCQNPAEKEQFEKNYKMALEARDVLLDKQKRAAYDRYGYKGLEDVGKSSSGPSFTGGKPISMPKTNVDPFDYFGKIADEQGKNNSLPPPVKQVDLGEAARQRRERMKKMSGGAPADKTDSSTPDKEKPTCITDAFRAALQQVRADMNLLGPLSNEPSAVALERLVQDLNALQAEAKVVLDRARKNSLNP